jgi:8-oxo-dGTP diphosphatase
MNESPRIIFSVKALLLHGDKLLVLHKKSNNQMPVFLWDLPGGTMEFGETPEETIFREITEETGLIVSELRLYDTWVHKKDETTQLSGVIYIGKTCDTEISLSNEHDRFQWISLYNPEIEAIHPAFRPKIIKLRNEHLPG